MEKIISLFKRDYEGTRQVYNEVVAGAEWVLNGEGIPTIKIDGTSCLIRDWKLYRRYDAKKGKTPPDGFMPAQDPDEKTGHWPGWLLVDKDAAADKWHREAWQHFVMTEHIFSTNIETYELIGPKVQGNPYGLDHHELVQHGSWGFRDTQYPFRQHLPPPRDYDGLKAYFAENEIEGIVWHHPDGRMVKIKRKDFGYQWPIKK